jgi:hypothetical protein
VESKGKAEHRFAYELKHRSDIAASITLFAGDADLYVGTFPQVSSASYNWTVNAETTLHIRTEEPGYHLGWYYLLVKTTGTADFALTVHSRDSVVVLVDGWPQTYSLAFDPADWLLFEYQAKKDYSDCRLTPWTKGFQPPVYMDHTTNSMDRVPGPANSHYRFSLYDRIQGLSFSLPGGQSKYTIAVYGPESPNQSAGAMGDFQFYCQSRSASAQLTLDEETFGVVDSSSPYRHFELRLAQIGMLEVTVTPCSGNLDLVILRDYAGQQLDIKQRRVEDGRIVAELQAEEGLYIVRVEKNEGEEGSFQLIARLRTATSPISHLLYPGNSGLMDYTLSSKHITLNWFPLTDSTGTPVPYTTNVRYRPYLRLSSSALMTTACGMHVSALRHQALMVSEDKWDINTVVIEVPIEEGMLLINVLALVGAEDDPDVQSVAYQPVEIYIEPSFTRKWLYWGLIGTTISVSLLAIMAIWLCCRYRNLAKAVMTLQEVENQAVISYSIQQQRTPRQRTEGSTDTAAGLVTSEYLSTD